MATFTSPTRTDPNPEQWHNIRHQLAGEARAPQNTRQQPWSGRDLRLRQRILNTGPESLSDAELLEFLLLAANPDCNLTHLSERLVKRFGGLADVLDSSSAQLFEVHGLSKSTIAILKAMPEVARRMALEEILDRPVLSSCDSVLAYFRIALGHKKTEQFHLLYLDTRNCLIADERQPQGTVNHTPLYPREVIKRALELDASSLIMVHNHPSGDTTPSKADIAITKAVQAAAATVDITVHDHIVISRSGHNSFKTLGLL